VLLPTQYDSLHSLCLYIRLLGPIIGWISVNVALLGEPAAPPHPPPYRASPLSVPRPCLGGGLRVPSLLISLSLSFSFSAAGPEQLQGWRPPNRGSHQGQLRPCPSSRRADAVRCAPSRPPSSHSAPQQPGRSAFLKHPQLGQGREGTEVHGRLGPHYRRAGDGRRVIARQAWLSRARPS